MTCEQLKRFKEAKKCRFCGSELPLEEEIKREEGQPDDVCLKKDCQDKLRKNCVKVHPCGHPCRGFYGERECLPCLNAECAEKAREEAKAKGIVNANIVREGVDEDAFCTICYISELGSEPCVKLGCGHVFHIQCIKTIIDNKWPSPRITFGFMNCPSCKEEMRLDHCTPLAESLKAVKDIKDKI